MTNKLETQAPSSSLIPTSPEPAYTPLPQTDQEIRDEMAKACVNRMETALNADEIRIKATRSMIDRTVSGSGTSDFRASLLVFSDPNVMMDLGTYLHSHPSTISPEELDNQLRKSVKKGMWE